PTALAGGMTFNVGYAGDGNVELSWTDPVNMAAAAPIISYTVEVRSESNGTPAGVTGGVTRTTATNSLLFDGLTNGTFYRFRIRATNAVGTPATWELGNDLYMPGTAGNRQVTVAYTGAAQDW